MTAVATPQPRTLHSVCELARLVSCGECYAPPHAPCLRGGQGTRGYHVTRLGCALRQGLISGLDMFAVLDAAVVFTGSTVVYDEAEVPA